MPQRSIKQKVIEAVEGLPPDATREDAMERLHFVARTQLGLEQADAGNTISQEETRNAFSSEAHHLVTSGS